MADTLTWSTVIYMTTVTTQVSRTGSPSAWVSSAWGRLLLFMLPVAHLADELRFGSATWPLSWVIVLTAGLLLVRPGSAPLLVALIGTKILHVMIRYPAVNNHDLIYLAVDLIVLVAVIASLRRRQDLLSDPVTTRALRVALLLAYGFAATAKWNSAFFDPATGCAAVLTRRAVSFLPALSSVAASVPDSVWLVVAVVVACTETAIVVLLAIPRLRRTGVFVAVFFHTAMAVSPNAIGLAFFACLLLGLTAFLDEPQAQKALEPYDRFRSTLSGVADRLSTRVRPRLLRAATLVAGPVVAIVSYAFARSQVDGLRWWVVLLPVVAVMAAVVLTGASAGRWTAPSEPSNAGRAMVVAFGLLLAVIPAAGLSPYLGAGNTPAFGMYSNVRTEGGSTNHLVIPNVALFDTQDRLVELQPTNNMLMTWHEARRLATQSSEPVYVKDHVTGAVVEVPAERSFGDWLAFKFVSHRAIDKGVVRCRW